MASYGITAQGDHARSTIAEAKGLTVDRLKKVLRSENLQVSGVKSELQIRLIAHIEKCAASGEHDRVNRIRNSIRGATGTYSNPYPSPYSTNTPTASLSPQFASPTPRSLPSSMPSYPMPSYPPNRVSFKPSPFYSILKALAPMQELKAREQTRDTARLNIMLDISTIDQLQRDPNVRIMVFCAAESFDSRHIPCDISFPQHGELKCNSDDVKANLKGLKNKPGTTRPADITGFIRKKPNFPNSIELVYALTTKESRSSQKYYLVVNLVQTKPVDSLLSELRRGKYISKDRVVREMQSQASDPDIVAMSSVMSLKDPVQMTRIQTPCRSVTCKHNECFDAAAYLYLQEQAPTWLCPFCNRAAPWDSLIFDQYFDDILRNVSPDVEQVTVEPDGRWHIEDVQASVSGGKHQQDSDDDDEDDDVDDDDLVMIPDPWRSSSNDFLRTPSVVKTPPLPGPSSSATHSSNKRKHAETIDLTEDDSDDDQPVRLQPKRSNTGTSSLLSFTNQYQSPQNSALPYHFNMPPPPSSSSNIYHTNGYFTG